MKQNIADRIKFFISDLNITDAQFADSCSIPRPSLSLILSGKNKKITDATITKIHNAYPSLSISWLLFGEGKMILNNEPLHKCEVNEGIKVLENAINPDDTLDDLINGKEMDLKYIGNPNQPSHTQSNISGIKLPQKTTGQVSTVKIENITVYFSDSTYKVFYPKE